MSRLVVNPGTAQAWEIHLKPGANTLGRGDSNDFQINDPSVSGSHCEIFLNNNLAVLRDAGSTNGTFVAGSPVRERQLENGQPVRLGGVEMVFYSDTTAAAGAAASRPVIKVSDILGPAPAARRVQTRPAAPAARVPQAAPVGEGATEIISGSRYCKYHPTSPARHLCSRCNLTFCDLCTDFIQEGERMLRKCRRCGAEVVPFQFYVPPARGFYSKLPGAFAYPFKGAGVIILVCAAIAFAALNFLSFAVYAILMKVVFYGFLFLFMQNIIHTTTSDEKEGLSFPEPSNLLTAAFQLGGTILASFCLYLALLIATFKDVPVPPEALMASVILGGIYFPMALLAVAMKDTVLAANPLIVLPAMVKAPVKYSVTAILALTVFGIRKLGIMVSGVAGTVSLRTHNMHKFMLAVAIQMALALLNVYLLTVTMRLLGLFYNSSKQKLGWYSS